MKHFTLKELCHSNTALRLGIKNEPTGMVKANLTQLVDNLLDPIREKWGQPILVNSGYRCEKLNKAVGGAKSSQHLTGCAADIRAVNKADNRKLFELIKNSGLAFDQLIWEYGTKSNPQWVHVSYRQSANRRQVLHLGVK